MGCYVAFVGNDKLLIIKSGILFLSEISRRLSNPEKPAYLSNKIRYKGKRPHIAASHLVHLSAC